MTDLLYLVGALFAGVLLPLASIKAWSKRERLAQVVPFASGILLPATGVVLLRNEVVSSLTAVAVAGSGIAVLVAYTLSKPKSRERLRRDPALSFIFISFAVVESLSAVWNRQIPFDIVGAGNVLTLWVGPLVAYWAVAWRSASDIRALIINSGGALLTFSYAVELLAPSATSLSGSNSRYQVLGSIDRLAGATTSPNALGLVGLVVAIAAVQHPSKGRRVALLTYCLPGIVLSQQRAALLGVVFACMAVGYLRTRLGAAPLVVAGVVATLLSPAVWIGLQSAAPVEGDASVQGRLAIWEFIWARSSESPIIGWGPAGVYQRSTQFNLQEPFSHAHNQLLNSFATGGAILLVVTIVLLGRLVRGVFSKDGEQRARALVVTSGLLLVLAFESPLQAGMNPLTLPQLILSWLVIALAFCSSQRTTESAGPTPGRTMIRR